MKKNTLKRVGASLLTAAMLMASITGCGGNNDSGANSSGGGTDAAQAEDNTAGGVEQVAAASDDNGEIVKLRVWGFGYTATSEDCAAVSEAVSAITRDAIGVEVEMVRDGDGDKLNLAMNSGEQWDLVNYHAFSGGLPTLVTNGMAMPIDDLVAEYGQDAAAVIGEDMMAAGKINGVQYSIPSVNVFSNAYGMCISSEILDELSIDPATLKTWDDLHEAFLKMKEAHPDKYPIVTAWAGGGMQKAFAWDNLGTGFWDGLGILENCHDGSTTVVNMYETDSYREICEMMYQWKQEGLLMPDATTTTENTTDLINTVGYATFENITPSKHQELESGVYWSGPEGVAVEVVPNFIDSSAGGSSFFIPTVCEHPEKAMQLWNLMYTNKEVADILTYGVEGRDFEYTDDSHEFVRQIEGSTYDVFPWSWPNQAIVTTREGIDKEIWNQNNAFDDAASVSPAIGFKFDNSMVMNEITACNNVIAKYEVGLRWGELNPDETLEKFNQELYDAGLQNIIDEKQRQLDAFLETK